MRKYKIALYAVAVALVIAAAAWYLRDYNIPVLEPRGTIGSQEKHLLIVGFLLTCIVIVPVFILTIVFAWRYREGNAKVKYSPDWDHNAITEFIWWAIPFTIIGILSVLAWKSSHSLDPWRPIASAKKPLAIQVVALDWKWLFIYPDESVASVNMAEVPVNTPISFEVTSDTVMNSFWVPQLGGQIYAMPGMSTRLQLMASKAGQYAGSSANISGQGFASMNFTIKAGSQDDFTNWAKSLKRGSNALDQSAYAQLAKPNSYQPVVYYSSVQNNLYENIIDKYMAPSFQLVKGGGSHP